MMFFSKIQTLRPIHPIRRKSLTLGSTLLPVALLAACSSTQTLMPVPEAAVPGNSDAGAAEADGVHVVAIANDWSGRPMNLNEIVTPLLVSIRNQSGQAIEIRYKDFSIAGPLGIRFAALPPYRIGGQVRSTGYPVIPMFAYNGFLLAPLYAPFYDWDFDDWDGPFDWDMGYYGTYYPMWSVPLPTRDMLRRGIPEGVLKNGGSLSGFLYFQRVASSKTSRQVEFNFDLNGVKGQQFGVLRIPFVAK